MSKIKLKQLLKENTPGFENRKFGDSLPTLASVQKAYEEKNNIKEEESVDEAAPKMKVYSWEKHFNAGQKELDKAANIMSRKSSGGYNNVKKDIMKVQKAINMLRSKMKINSTEF
jgi:hypothetical protein